MKFVCKNVIHLRFLNHQKVLIVENSTKVLFTVCYTNRQITALTFFSHYKNRRERQNSLILKVKKGQIVSKFDLRLLNPYNPMYFDRNISENKDGRAVICNER